MLLALLPMIAFAATPENLKTAAETEAIAATVMSPYCPGRLLRDCPSGQAAQLKTDIHNRLEAGESSTQIIDDLIAKFGEELRAAPKAEGFGLLAWVTPFFFLIAGMIIAFVWLRGRRRGEEAAFSPLDKEAEARLNSELR